MFRKCSLRIAALSAAAILIVGLGAARGQSATSSTRRQSSIPAKKTPQLDQKAVEILQSVRARLAAAYTLAFEVRATSERLSQGTPVVHTLQTDVVLQRPDKARVIVSGDRRQSQVFCNGRTMMTYSPVERAVNIVKQPPTIYDCLRDAHHASAVDSTIIDFVLANTSPLRGAQYVGQAQDATGTTVDIVSYSTDNLSVEMRVRTEDRLPTEIRATFRDDLDRLRQNFLLTNWRVDIHVRPDVFTALKVPSTDQAATTGTPRPVGSSGTPRAVGSNGTPRQVGTSGMLRSRSQGDDDSPLFVHSYSPKYWGSAPSGGIGATYEDVYNGTVQVPYGGYGYGYGYSQSPDGYGFYGPTFYGYSAPPVLGYTGAAPVPGYTVEPFGNDWSEGDASFDLALTGPTLYNPPMYNTSVTAPYPRFRPGYTPGVPRFAPGTILEKLPVGCAAPYTRGPAFYLCGSTWFSGVLGPDGRHYFRSISE